MKVILDYYNPERENKITETGFSYLSTKIVITEHKEISGKENIDIFKQFYKLNNSLRYCNNSYYKFQDKIWENKYKEWLDSDDYKKRSFELYYGNGVVD